MTLKTWVGIAGIAGFLLSLANAVQTDPKKAAGYWFIDVLTPPTPFC
jgi:hypothetical protein